MHNFSISRRGYDKDQVEAFLNTLNGNINNLNNANHSLQNMINEQKLLIEEITNKLSEKEKYIELLNQKYVETSKALKILKDKESTINHAIVSSQQAADNIVKNAVLQADEIKQETINNLSDVKNDINIHKEILVDFKNEYDKLIRRYVTDYNEKDFCVLFQKLDVFGEKIDQVKITQSSHQPSHKFMLDDTSTRAYKISDYFLDDSTVPFEPISFGDVNSDERFTNKTRYTLADDIESNELDEQSPSENSINIERKTVMPGVQNGFTSNINNNEDASQVTQASGFGLSENTGVDNKFESEISESIVEQSNTESILSNEMPSEVPNFVSAQRHEDEFVEKSSFDVDNVPTQTTPQNIAEEGATENEFVANFGNLSGNKNDTASNEFIIE